MMNKTWKRILQVGAPCIVLGAILIPLLGSSAEKKAPEKTQGKRAMRQEVLPVSGCVASMATASNGVVANGLLLPN